MDTDTTTLHAAELEPIELAPYVFGLQPAAVERYIRRGAWIEGRQFVRDAAGKVLLSRAGVSAWVRGESGAELPQPRAVAPARRRIEPEERTALYRHFDADGVLLYVGISLQPLARLKAHDARAHWYSRIARVDVEWLPSRAAALEAEATAIQAEAPLFNIKGRAC